MLAYNQLNKEDKENILHIYYNKENLKMSFSDMSKKCGVSKRAFSRVLSEYNIDTKIKRRYKIKNETYFDNIDTEIKAYFVGLLFADGYNGHNNEISISLKNCENTKNIFQIFLNEIGAENLEIVQFSVSSGYKTKNTFLKISFSNKYINESLKKIGMSDHKELSRKNIPTDVIKNNLENHFIRGLFDGDGSYTLINENVKLKYENKIVKKPYISFLSNEKLLLEIKEIFHEHLDTNDVMIRSSTNSNKISELRYKGKQVNKILDFLYNNATIYLTHKSPL